MGVCAMPSEVKELFSKEKKRIGNYYKKTLYEKKKKGDQEAHEACRCVYFKETLDSKKFSPEEIKLYESKYYLFKKVVSLILKIFLQLNKINKMELKVMDTPLPSEQLHN